MKQSCSLDSTQGQPVIFQQYWENPSIQNQYAFSPSNIYPPCLHLTPDYRSPYQMHGGDLEYAPLEKAIRRLHAVVGNAVTEGYELVVGHGSTGVMKSAMYALSLNHVGETQFFSVPPCYGKYKSQADSLFTRVSSKDFHVGRWNTEADVSKENVIEIVTYPSKFICFAIVLSVRNPCSEWYV